MNNVIIVGRLVSDPQINETEDGKKVTTIKLAVDRNFKNDEGYYETDFIPCVLWNGVAATTTEYCHKGDVIGVKGIIQSDEEQIYVIAEKVTFLKSSPKERE